MCKDKVPYQERTRIHYGSDTALSWAGAASVEGGAQFSDSFPSLFALLSLLAFFGAVAGAATDVRRVRGRQPLSECFFLGGHSAVVGQVRPFVRIFALVVK